MNSLNNKKIVIIDYEMGNLFSVNQALLNIGANAIISSDPVEVANADAIVLPGVGAFGVAMENLHKLGLVEPIKKAIAEGKPFLGVCLGLQLLFSKSEEFGSNEGLDIIKGTVKKFRPDSPEYKVPQIAWNSVSTPDQKNWQGTPLADIDNGDYFYFVHSFYVHPDDEKVALTKTTYGNTVYVSALLHDNIFACQFHPEKSAEKGIRIYHNWAKQNNLI